MANYLDKEFAIHAEGEGFYLSFRGEGDMEAAKAVIEKMTGLPCKALFLGMSAEDREDMNRV